MIELRKDIIYKIEIVNGINKGIEKTSRTSYYTGQILEEDEKLIKIKSIRDEIVILTKENIIRMTEDNTINTKNDYWERQKRYAKTCKTKH